MQSLFISPAKKNEPISPLKPQETEMKYMKMKTQKSDTKKNSPCQRKNSPQEMQFPEIKF